MTPPPASGPKGPAKVGQAGGGVKTEAILFDFGGTLDGYGTPWLDRFYPLYLQTGLSPDRETFAKAFYAADNLLLRCYPLKQYGFRQTLNAQIESVLENLGASDMERQNRILESFLSEAEKAIRDNKTVLEELRRSYRLGIISNFYGNLENILKEYGLLPLLDVWIDSELAGFEKPDSRIFWAALNPLRLQPEQAVYVGDSIPRDMQGAANIGMPHVWVSPDGKPRQEDPSADPFPCCRHPMIRHLRQLQTILPALQRKNIYPPSPRLRRIPLRNLACLPERQGLQAEELHAGIIAAGEGSRLQSLHPNLPKALIPVKGKSLLERTLQNLSSAGVTHCLCILNEKGREIPKQFRPSCPAFQFPDLDWIIQTTASSLESFQIVSRRLAREAPHFLMTTVDSVYAPKSLQFFLAEALSRKEALAVLGVTSFVDDEKPLWVEMNESGKISGIGPGVRQKKYATCGLYFLSREILLRASVSLQNGKTLRDWWTELTQKGVPLHAVEIPKVVDVDRPQDILAAEKFLDELRIP